MVVLGGGPGGLFAARLLALRHPDWTVTVHEKRDPEATFGFGVGLSGATLTAIRDVDPETHAGFDDFATWFQTASFVLPRGSVTIPSFHRGLAVERAALLRHLTRQAERAGVRVVHGDAPDVDDLRQDADVVIAADGVSSGTRTRFEEVFRPEIALGRGMYLWCGSDTSLEGTVFQPVETEHGTFTAHAYPYGPARATLVIETTEETLQRAGLGAALPVEASDDVSLGYLSDAFATLLDGRPLRGNRSQWFRFRTVTNRTWVHENIALLGDAAATADPSLGSGTKLALESAIAIADALDRLGELSVAECLHLYEQSRRPRLEALQDRALRSQRWWDTLPERLDLVPARIAVAYLSRAGAVGLDRMLPGGPDLVRTAIADWAGIPLDRAPSADLADWILARPLEGAAGVPGPAGVEGVAGAAGEAGAAGSRQLTHAEIRVAFGDGVPAPLAVTTDDPWGGAADDLVAAAKDLVDRGAPCLLLTGAPGFYGVLDRAQLAERIRRETGVPVGIEAGPADADIVAAGIVTARFDFAYDGAMAEAGAEAAAVAPAMNEAAPV